jgi:hypothetical protein
MWNNGFWICHAINCISLSGDVLSRKNRLKAEYILINTAILPLQMTAELILAPEDVARMFVGLFVKRRLTGNNVVPTYAKPTLYLGRDKLLGLSRVICVSCDYMGRDDKSGDISRNVRSGCLISKCYNNSKDRFTRRPVCVCAGVSHLLLKYLLQLCMFGTHILCPSDFFVDPTLLGLGRQTLT